MGAINVKHTGSGADVNISSDGTDLLLNGTAIGGGGGSSTLTIDNKTGAYTVVSGDLGKIINCTSGTFTVSLTAAATLGAGFYCWVYNTTDSASNFLVTIDPAGSETIGFQSTYELRQTDGVKIVSDGTNWIVSDARDSAFFVQNFRSAFSQRAQAAGLNSTSIGRGTDSSGAESFAAGQNSSGGGAQALGSGAMALGGSYASGTDSFAAAIANNTASYGATGANSVAMGDRAKASGDRAFSLGRFGQATNARSINIGDSAICSGDSALAIGYTSVASQSFSTALGYKSLSDIVGKYAYAGGAFVFTGDSQTGTFVLRSNTTDATAKALTTNNTTAGTDDQIILPNNSAYAFHGTIVARQQASEGTACAAWKIEGLIRREGSAGATVLVNSATTVLDNTPAWGMTLSADTTNGGLKIEVTGAAATNIRWVATINTSEVTY